jgi:tRNA-2-methylthio-N6-dimethylallyladenosine synthase
MPSFSVVTFGCQMNMHDSTRMEEVLRGAGYSEASDVENADVVLLNTCSVREKAEQKLRSEVGRLGLLKARRPDLVIGVAGCVAQQEGERLLKGLPQIDLILGPDNIPELPKLLADLETGGLPQVRTVFDVEEPSFLAARPEHGTQSATAFVTVMKGCNERCSYCIVPYTRGPERYRSSHEIVDEVARLVAAGVREVTLLGQTVNSYIDPAGALPKAPGTGDGRWQHTRGALARQDETEFPALLRRIAAEVPALARLRYTSPHPRHLTSSLIAAHRDLPVLARHVHMPVQSGSDRLLKRMIRRYSAAEYVERTDALKDAVPGLTLTTDVIVGFPGETEEDFEATLQLVRRVGFVALFGFKYSQRPYTPALQLADDVSEEEKGRRLEKLFSVVDESKQAHLASLVGRTERVLVEGLGRVQSDDEASLRKYTGRTERSEIVHFECPVDLTGHMVDVRVREAFKNSLGGELVTKLTAELLASARGASKKPGAHAQSVVADGRRALPVLG